MGMTTIMGCKTRLKHMKKRNKKKEANIVAAMVREV